MEGPRPVEAAGEDTTSRLAISGISICSPLRKFLETFSAEEILLLHFSMMMMTFSGVDSLEARLKPKKVGDEIHFRWVDSACSTMTMTFSVEDLEAWA